jgi:hypothetical protein
MALPPAAVRLSSRRHSFSFSVESARVWSFSAATARAGKRRKGLLSALHVYTKAPPYDAFGIIGTTFRELD